MKKKTCLPLLLALGLALGLTACGSSGGKGADAAPPRSTGAPAISGAPNVGQTLQATAGSWSGTQPITTTFEWRRCDSGGEDCEAIAGAEGASYVPTTEQLGWTLRVRVTAVNAYGEAQADSEAVGPVEPAGPVNIVPPSISGNAIEGGTLTAQAGTWTAQGTLTLARAWERCAGPESPCDAIPGATGEQYNVTAADLGYLLRLRVVATDTRGSVELSSAATAPVALVACAAALQHVGPVTPGLVASRSVTMPWTSPASVFAADGASASATLAPGARSDWLVARGLGVTLPAGAEVRGLDVAVVGRSASGAGIRLTHAEILTDEGWYGTDVGEATWGTQSATVHVGGSTDLWGATWTPAQLASPDLAVRLMFENAGGAVADTVQVDAIQLVVHYATFGQAGPAHPATVVQRQVEAGDVAWDSPAGAATDDASRAVAVLGPQQTSQTLVATGFGLSLPAGKVPSGVVVEIEEQADSAASWVVQERDVQLVLGGVALGTTRADPFGQGWPKGAELVRHGGGADLWGAQLGAADVANASFGVQLKAYNYSGGATVQAELAQLRMWVLYDPVLAQVTGKPSAAESVSGSLAWSDAGKAAVSDGAFAIVSGMSGQDVTDDLAGTQLGLSVPVGATIHGVELVIRRRGMNGNLLIDSNVQLLREGKRDGGTRARSTPWSTTLADVTYGGPEDLWGHVWTPAEVNATGFGAALSVAYGGTSGNDWARVDGMQVTVYYCAP